MGCDWCEVPGAIGASQCSFAGVSSCTKLGGHLLYKEQMTCFSNVGGPNLTPNPLPSASDPTSNPIPTPVPISTPDPLSNPDYAPSPPSSIPPVPTPVSMPPVPNPPGPNPPMANSPNPANDVPSPPSADLLSPLPPPPASPSPSAFSSFTPPSSAAPTAQVRSNSPSDRTWLSEPVSLNGSNVPLADILFDSMMYILTLQCYLSRSMSMRLSGRRSPIFAAGTPPKRRAVSLV